ncbi:MAG: hypothetical protein AAB337_03900 [Patescibacteria group bacterium]
MMLNVINTVPLLSPMGEPTGGPPSNLRITLVCVILSTIGYVDGRMNPHNDETHARWLYHSLVASGAGLSIGMAYMMWSPNMNELWTHFIQFMVAVGGSMLWLSLAHIAGYSPESD